MATVAKSSLSLTQGHGGLGVLTLGFELQENLQPSVPEEAEQSQPGREERGEKHCREGWEPSHRSTSSAARRLQCAAASPAATAAPAAGNGSGRARSDKREGWGGKEENRELCCCCCTV